MKHSILDINPKNDKEILSAVGHIWEQRASYKYVLERQWYTAIAWYLGLQNLIWSDSQKSLTEIERAPHRVRLVVNHLQSIVRTIAAKLYKASPEWDVLPASTDPLDAQKAYVANQILSCNWQKMLMPEKMLETLMWTLTTGNCFIKQTWNPDAGDSVYVPSEIGIEEVDPTNVGEVEATVISPFELIVDPNATKFRDAAWCIESRYVNVQDIMDLYPRADLKPTEGEASFNFLQFKEHLKHLTSGNLYKNANYTQSGILVHELWIKPRPGSKTLSKGRHVVIAGGQVLKNVEFPYNHGELPFAHFIEIEVPGRLWATSTIEQLMPIQAEYNRTRSQLVETRNTTGNPNWLIPKGAGISEAQITGRPGEKIYYNPGFKPEQTNPPSLPAYINNMLSVDRQDMEDLSGMHEVSRAEAPGQVRSGRGILALVEQDETRLGIIIRQFEFQVERLGRQHLQIVAQYVSEKRILNIIGAQDELITLSYRGSDLIGPSSLVGSNYFDVRVKTVSGMPLSRAAQQELLSLLLQNNVLKPDDPKDRRMILQMISIGHVQNTVDKSRMHRSRQLVEIDKIISGEDVIVQQWHGHEIHLEVLDEFRNSALYDSLPPEIQMILQRHSEAHKEWIAYNAVEPEILTRKAAMVAMQYENLSGVLGTIAQTQGPAANVLEGVSNEGQQNQSQGIRQESYGGGGNSLGSQQDA